MTTASFTYDQACLEIKSGDIIALTHNSWASWYDLQIQAVRIGTMSEYCHVGLIWEIGGRFFVIESVEPKVRLVPLVLYAKQGFYWTPSPGRVEISDDELKFALERVGVAGYSKWLAFCSYFRKITGRSGSASELEECAKFLIECRLLSGVNLGDSATPAAVMRNLMDQGQPVRLVKGLI
jgi:hypothetical protein